MTIALSPLAGPDQQATRAAFGRFPSGVAALCAVVDDESIALVASSFQVGISMDPPLVLFAVQKSSTTWPVLKRAGRIGVSILSADHAAICRQLASKDKTRRFDGIALHRSDSDALLLEESAAWLECSVHAETDAGDHEVIMLEIRSLHVPDDVEPLVFHRSTFRQLV